MGFAELIETRLRVLTWNVWWQYGPWQDRYHAIEMIIERVDADLVGLQEVWSKDGKNLAGMLAERFGYQHVYRTLSVKDGVGFGNAILSRWPIERTEMRELPGVYERDEKRLVLAVETRGPRGHIQSFCTHLNYLIHDSDVRQRQVAAIAELVELMGPRDYVPIVCGDFNAVPTADEIRMLTGETTVPVAGRTFRDAWAEAGHGPGFTWDNNNPFAGRELEPSKRIDYLFAGYPKARGAGHIINCELVGNEPVDGVWASDHFGLMAELRY